MKSKFRIYKYFYKAVFNQFIERNFLLKVIPFSINTLSSHKKYEIKSEIIYGSLIFNFCFH